jgi:hypothetical protein
MKPLSTWPPTGTRYIMEHFNASLHGTWLHHNNIIIIDKYGIGSTGIPFGVSASVNLWETKDLCRVCVCVCVCVLEREL